MSKVTWNDVGGALVWIVIASGIILWIGLSIKADNEKKGSKCVDVTTYDYNWDNDMKCTKPDGGVFYTDYAGARKYD